MNYLEIQCEYGRAGENSFASRPRSSVSSETRRKPNFFIALKKRLSTMPLHKAMAIRPTCERQGAKREGFRCTRNPCRLMDIRLGIEVQASKSSCIFPPFWPGELHKKSHSASRNHVFGGFHILSKAWWVNSIKPKLPCFNTPVQVSERNHNADRHTMDLQKIDPSCSRAASGADAPHNSGATASDGVLRMLADCSARFKVARPMTIKRCRNCRFESRGRDPPYQTASTTRT